MHFDMRSRTYLVLLNLDVSNPLLHIELMV